MTYLYPRLLDNEARKLFTEYHSLGASADPRFLSTRASTRSDAAVFIATGGDRISSDRLDGMRSHVVELAHSYGFPDDHRDLGDFDIRLAEYLHRTLEIAPAEAASRDVWTFLSIVLLPDVAFWRFPDANSDRVLSTDITRHVFGRLWWRAQLVHDPMSEKPYGVLSILGEADFDQVYARRTALGGSPRLVRQILLVWSELRSNLDSDGPPSRVVLRDFLKRLRRLTPFVSYDSLDDDTLHEEIRLVMVETLNALRSQPAEVSQ